jgi:hypothetical protein
MISRAGRAVLIALVVMGTFLVFPAASTAPAACGSWRWDVKTLSDPNRASVRLRPRRVPVAGFRTRSRPPVTFNGSTPRYGAVEHHVWSLRARPIRAKVEGDGDVHLIISVPNSRARTMIVEFPRKICVDAAYKRNMIAAARRKFINNCGPVNDSWSRLTGLVTVTGVGFWDSKHGQSGVAANGIELHPVLNFTGDCHKATGGGGGGGNCSPSYPDHCIPPPPPDLDCADVPWTNFRVLPPDPHGFDGDHDGVGCET